MQDYLLPNYLNMNESWGGINWGDTAWDHPRPVYGPNIYLHLKIWIGFDVTLSYCLDATLWHEAFKFRLDHREEL